SFQPAGGNSGPQLISMAMPGSVIDVSSTNNVELFTSTSPNAAGEIWKVLYYGRIFNNSAATKKYTWRFQIGELSVDIADGTTVATHAINIAILQFEATVFIKATDDVKVFLVTRRSIPAAITASQSINAASYRHRVYVGTNDVTGSTDITCHMRSSAVANTQTFTLDAYEIYKITI